MEKGRIVDTGFYGSFAKASSISGDQTNYIYCPGPKSILKLVENDDNLVDLPQHLLDERLASLSVSHISETSGATSEVVHSILAGIRDEIVDTVLVRKNNASLNFGFGVLNLRANGTVEFKSTAGAVTEQQIEDKIPASSEFGETVSTVKKALSQAKKYSETASQKSIAERSLNFMQQR